MMKSSLANNNKRPSIFDSRLSKADRARTLLIFYLYKYFETKCSIVKRVNLIIDDRTSLFFSETFSDIDECAEGTAKCTDICRNEPGTYLCECHHGFALGNDGHSCQGYYKKRKYYIKKSILVQMRDLCQK